MKREALVRKIKSDIRAIRIQGATAVAKAAVKAYILMPTDKNKKDLEKLRPTEPMLFHALNKLHKGRKEEVLTHLSETQKKINVNVLKVIRGKKKIFTHCHSSNVTSALIYAKKKGMHFRVCNTETRPLYQGRKTARELSRAGIIVENFIDSGMHAALKEVDVILIGADAILSEGVINKIGSDAIAEISFVHKKPLYIVADSWKYSPKHVKIEERDFHEVWARSPKNVKVQNPAFEMIESKYIRGVVSELGVLSFKEFLKKAERNYKN
ncbi:MAG: hypothetical protein WCK90_04665 [archaeon]